MSRHLIAGLAALSLLSGGIAAADEGKFETGLIGATPGGSVAGVPAGGAPWTVSAAEAEISESGRIEVKIRGLLIIPPAPTAGTTGPVKSVAASLACGGSGGTVVASTGGVPLSAAGNAEIEQTIPLPASCLAPVVLIRVFNTGAAGAYIAASGFLD